MWTARARETARAERQLPDLQPAQKVQASRGRMKADTCAGREIDDVWYSMARRRRQLAGASGLLSQQSLHAFNIFRNVDANSVVVGFHYPNEKTVLKPAKLFELLDDFEVPGR